MEEKSAEQYHEWGVQVSRVMELIAITTQTIERHNEINSPETYIKQYKDLLEVYKGELKSLMKKMGFTMRLSPLKKIA